MPLISRVSLSCTVATLQVLVYICRHQQAHQRLVVRGGAQRDSYRGCGRARAATQYGVSHMAGRGFRAGAVVGHLALHAVAAL